MYHSYARIKHVISPIIANICHLAFPSVVPRRDRAHFLFVLKVPPGSLASNVTLCWPILTQTQAPGQPMDFPWSLAATDHFLVR